MYGVPVLVFPQSSPESRCSRNYDVDVSVRSAPAFLGLSLNALSPVHLLSSRRLVSRIILGHGVNAITLGYMSCKRLLREILSIACPGTARSWARTANRRPRELVSPRAVCDLVIIGIPTILESFPKAPVLKPRKRPPEGKAGPQPGSSAAEGPATSLPRLPES